MNRCKTCLLWRPTANCPDGFRLCGASEIPSLANGFIIEPSYLHSRLLTGPDHGCPQWKQIPQIGDDDWTAELELQDD